MPFPHFLRSPDDDVFRREEPTQDATVPRRPRIARKIGILDDQKVEVTVRPGSAFRAGTEEHDFLWATQRKDALDHDCQQFFSNGGNARLGSMTLTLA